MVYNSWFSVENSTRRAAFCIIGSGYGVSLTVMIEVRDKCLGAVADSVGGSSPSSEQVLYYLNQDKILILQPTKCDIERNTGHSSLWSSTEVGNTIRV